jgi:hypothetical protein
MVGDIKDTFLKTLEWVGHNPMRLFTLIVIAMFGMGMWFVYTEKDAFMNSYRAQQALPHMNGKYEDATTFIMRQGEADLVAIFEVNPLLNTRKLVYLTVKPEGRVRTNEGIDVGLFTNNLDNNRDVVELMSGNVPCSSYTRPQSLIGFFYMEKGITYMCRISVPPDPSRFIGQITVGWKEHPSDDQRMRTVIRVAAEILWNR